jgi:hypothetical protein
MQKNPSVQLKRFLGSPWREQAHFGRSLLKLRGSVLRIEIGPKSEDEEPSAGDFFTPKRQHRVALFGS